MKNVSQTGFLLSKTMVFKGEKLVCVRYRMCFNRQTGQWGCNKALNEVPTIPIHIHTHISSLATAKPLQFSPRFWA